VSLCAYAWLLLTSSEVCYSSPPNEYHRYRKGCSTTAKRGPTATSDRERRRWERLPLGIPVFVSATDAYGSNFLEFSNLLNVSRGGALLATRKHLRRDSRVLLQFPSPAFVTSMTPVATVRDIDAVVVRIDSSEGSNICGLRFVRPLPS
jgi:hypothetical protein